MGFYGLRCTFLVTVCDCGGLQLVHQQSADGVTFITVADLHGGVKQRQDYVAVTLSLCLSTSVGQAGQRTVRTTECVFV